MKKPLYIYGAGGLGREVLSMVNAMEEWQVPGFFDDGMEKGKLIRGVPVLGGRDVLNALKEEVNLVLALGDAMMKSTVVRQLSGNIHYPVLRHPTAILQDPDSIQIGKGTILTAGVILTTDIIIGEHVLINLNSTVGHDTRIGSYSSIMPGTNIAGEVSIGDSVLIGSGSCILNRVRIGNRSKVGMGAVVIQDVEEDVTVVGNPGRVKFKG